MSIGGDWEGNADRVQGEDRVSETCLDEVVGMGKTQEEDGKDALEIY